MPTNVPSRLCTVLLGMVYVSGAVLAAPPTKPLPSPFFSFDLSSPAVANSFVEADDILTLNLPYPVPVIPAAALGLGATGDDLDALSGDHPAFSSETHFAIRFSVTRESTGNVPPDPVLVNESVPYNVMDQAGRGHQAGDEYLTLRNFTLQGPLAGRGSTPDNNTMVNNNYDEGGSDFAARPETHANSVVAEPQDNVDALADLDVSAVAYYSATSTSPSLSSLPGSATPSGASIFCMRVGVISMYASYAQLGLQQADDIDAIIVFDFEANDVFNGADRILFSLTPGSPSLATIPGVTISGAADVFIAAPGQPPALFAPAASLGLASLADDVDALEILVMNSTSSGSSITAFAIRLLPGDFDGDADVDSQDLESFDDCYRGQGQSYDLGCEPGDFDGDSDIDCRDGSAFMSAWTAPESPGIPTPCRASIPTVSQWGVLILALAVMAAGSIVSRARQV